MSFVLLGVHGVCANSNVYVSRFWHNHQPTYWPEWNTNGDQNNRVEYVWDSIVLKNNRSYTGSNAQHPENNLGDIFGLDDRRNAYQSGPRNSVANIDQRGGFAMSYSGSLIDNVRQLGALGQLGYGNNWNGGNREARQWTTTAGAPRIDLVGFTYHHSLGPLLPKAVLRKEIQIFKQAWWKAWGGSSDLSDHSKGFFPTEMAFSRHIVDVLVEEGYEWVIVASHHLSRTCPTYFDQFDLDNNQYGIFSSPPNRSDLLGPSPDNGWWYSEPNPGNAAWNVAPYAYQLHKSKYVNPETGEESTIVMVPSDDVLSYRYGYANEGTGKIGQFISPFANDSSRPVLVMPATDGDNAWGGGSSSWFEATPQLFGESASAGYNPTSPQDFVDAHGASAPVAHIEDGAWIFPESDYGSPYFLKWIEPPVAASPELRYPGTVVDMETPGFALKFWSWAPVITGANWVETAEQILRDEGGSVEAWKIQAPYDWDGTYTSPNDVELAWHIYLTGLDSGFNYYGGLGNDDEVKPALATTRAIQRLQSWMTEERRANDRTSPSVLKPQRFPYNPGAYTFGWFNSIPGGDTSYLKKMPSEFYIWTHAYDVSGLTSVNLKIRVDADGINPLSNNQNETYGGGSDVGDWITVPMTQRELPATQSALNAAANNGQINYFIEPPELADYYYAKITNAVLPAFRDKLLDYYVEATDTKGNVHKSEIQHVFVEDDGAVTDSPGSPTNLTAMARSSSTIDLSWTAAEFAQGYRIFRDSVEIASVSGTAYSDTGLSGDTTYQYAIQAYNSQGDSTLTDGVSATTPPAPAAPDVPTGLSAVALSATSIELSWDGSAGATEYRLLRGGVEIAQLGTPGYTDTGLAPDTNFNYAVTAGNAGGFSMPSSVVSVRTHVAPPSFSLGESSEPSGYLLLDPGMRLFTALRGTLLYVATWTPTGGDNDHFIFVTDTLEPSASVAQVWDKAGLSAQPDGKPFLAAESVNSYAAWFNTTGATEVWRASTGGGRLEGVIDLVEVFGSLPQTVYIAAVAYQTADAGLLGAQAPVGNGDNNLDPNEFLALPVAAVRDVNSDGTLDRLDPDRGFIARPEQPEMPSGNVSLAWPVVPGVTYQVRYSYDFLNWNNVPNGRFTAGSGETELSYSWEGGVDAPVFFDVEIVQPD
ncbi:fibronectin type III domain-containing protein [Rubellicoccus peritrichatus]|uniref:Fibronectin type-III domain-containing protein n=1 Tax=Rubellicoccus peritrichatus TaxID=3080537 RepID=A0AAQ3L995_9BACT|nr:hypothetical protein [Puniceicoccus sp. CR14]WOO41720.1 hypothetical protein RZN69_01370 [Puniceicoccus sp. CR14]